MTDGDWLDAAARLGLRARPLSRPNPAVGAILVRGGVVVGRGWTQPGGRPHAEAMALAAAGPAARGAVAYVTLEPCAHASPRGPCCARALIDAGVARVVAGVADPDTRTDGRGVAMLRAAGVAAQVRDRASCRDSLAGYLTRHRFARPYVTLKLAQSLDGVLAMADGRSRWITGPAARAHVHSRRALADAIVVGGATWRADAPALDVRLPGLERRSPERWVLTSGPLDEANVLGSPQAIAGMAGLSYLYVEGGGGAAASFLAADLVDRLDLYTAPIVIGAPGRRLGDIGLADLADAHGLWRQVERRQLGSDSFAAYERVRCSPA